MLTTVLFRSALITSFLQNILVSGTERGINKKIMRKEASPLVSFCECEARSHRESGTYRALDGVVLLLILKTVPIQPPLKSALAQI